LAGTSQILGLEQILPTVPDPENVDHVPADLEQDSVRIAALAVVELA
jgi:hypothetical protein